jgi:MerR family transcriptional regulator/heat shock protein HspR
VTHDATPRSARGVYGISVTSELSGLDPQSLRLYERRGLLTPTRTDGGTRRYSEDDLTRLARITDLIAQGVNLAGIAHILELEHRITQLESDNARLMSGHTPPTRTAAGRPHEHERGAIMTNAEDVPLTEDKPEADVAEQQIPVDLTVDEAGLDPTHIANRSDAQANLADLIDQAISVPLSDGDRPVQY